MQYSKYLLICLLAFFPYQIFAQSVSTDEMDITGLWKGNLYNDSTKQFYKYEIGISDDKGKLSGFSHTWYNDRDYFVVKKVKIKRKDGKIIIEDVDIISYNYPESPPKGVRRLHVLTLQVQDSILVLSGVFETNQTKQFAPATGTVNLQRKNDYRKQSDLMAKLQELGVEDKLSFVAKDKELAKLKEDKTLNKIQSPVSKAGAQDNKAGQPSIIASNKKKIAVEPLAKLPGATKPPAFVNSTVAAAEVLIRKNVLQETMYFKSDSLDLSLYDNGVVDGDTVSVLMNGKIIMAKQGLSTKEIRQTIHIPPGMDSIELVMYAENLGSIAPNTGLLVVHDGKDLYEIRFSGDLEKNAAIILKRRKK